MSKEDDRKAIVIMLRASFDSSRSLLYWRSFDNLYWKSTYYYYCASPISMDPIISAKSDTRPPKFQSSGTPPLKSQPSHARRISTTSSEYLTNHHCAFNEHGVLLAPSIIKIDDLGLGVPHEKRQKVLMH